MPFLKIGIFGVYIQKADSTKNRREAPKKMYRKYTGLSVVALWSRFPEDHYNTAQGVHRHNAGQEITQIPVNYSYLK